MTDRARRALLTAAILSGCFVWAMVVVGLSFAMVDHGARQWWVIPLFGALVLLIAVLAVRRLPATSHPVAVLDLGTLAQMSDASAPPAAVAADPAAVAAPPAPVAAVGPAEPLSPREMEVLGQLAAGRSNREIAETLFVAPGTVKAHLSHIFRKLRAESRLQAVAHARRSGLLDPAPQPAGPARREDDQPAD
ncbi:helix-turn-helix transcriptional regulator [Actinoplanes sp. M2I2]|uniref:helix-turn-helix transcriptional regulator n=1 Tax=Actinoplanes sp. M2I2 TaxID=1734444 RepID=UPI002020EAFE|nr:helix-turn-helix transcriptional regulator [Actinoplanes sp. M2I2]